MDMNEITEFGKQLTEACMLYYDMVNNTDNFNICVGMSVEVKDNNTDKRYRYNVKIEKRGALSSSFYIHICELCCSDPKFCLCKMYK